MVYRMPASMDRLNGITTRTGNTPNRCRWRHIRRFGGGETPGKVIDGAVAYAINPRIDRQQVRAFTFIAN
jgi:hypothetical protein